MNSNFEKSGLMPSVDRRPTSYTFNLQQYYSQISLIFFLVSDPLIQKILVKSID